MLVTSAAHVVTARLIEVLLVVGHRWLDLSEAEGRWPRAEG